MTEHFRLTPRPVNVERVLRRGDEDVAQRFLGDPANWLPGRITMHGASTFVARQRVLGARSDVEYLVGTPWTRSEMVTRRLRVRFPEPPLGMGWMMPVVDGELTIEGRPLRRLCFEGTAVAPGPFNTHRLVAAHVMRPIVSGIAERLSKASEPVPRRRLS